jgi:hypothetical protein
MTEGPRRASSVLRAIDITGYLMPAEANRQPVLLRMPGTDNRYIAVFSTNEKLLRLWRDYPQLPAYRRIQKIDDGLEFITSLKENNHPELCLIVDPYRHDSGKLRWVEIPLLQDLPAPT